MLLDVLWHHRYGSSPRWILPDEVDYLARCMGREGHGCALTVCAPGWSSVVRRWGCWALRQHVGNGRTVEGSLLLLRAPGGGRRSTAGRQGQDGLVHPCCQPAHHVGAGRVPVVRRFGSPAGFARVGIVNVAPVQETVVPIFVPLERSGRTLVLCACSAETIPGWLLVAAAVSTSASASASSSGVVGRALVLRGGIVVAWGLVYRAWGLLADRHAELLDVCQLPLHCGKAGSLALDCFLRGRVRGAKVRHRLGVRRKRCVIVDCSHAIAMLRGRGCRLIDERNRP